MIKEVLEYLIQALSTAGLYATYDSRNIDAPGCFINVTKLVAEQTLTGSYTAEGSIVAMVKDLGGRSDIEHLSAIADNVIAACQNNAIVIKYVETNHQATTPTGARLPAVNIAYNLNIQGE